MWDLPQVLPQITTQRPKRGGAKEAVQKPPALEESAKQKVEAF